MIRACQSLVAAAAFHRFVLGVIVLAGVVVGLETVPELVERHGALLRLMDAVIMAVFVAEIVVKLGAHRWSFRRYLADPWNLFDFTIVLICLLPLDTHFAAVLRLARLLRVLRLVSALPKLQFLVGALLKSVSAMGNVALLLLLLFYIYAVMGVFLFGQGDPRHFASIPVAMLTLFRVLTLEGWTDIMDLQLYPAAQVGSVGTEALDWVGTVSPSLVVGYFVSFILLGTMIMLNLFIGIIMNGMTEMHQETEAATRKEARDGTSTLTSELAALETKIEELQRHVRALRRETAGHPPARG